MLLRMMLLSFIFLSGCAADDSVNTFADLTADYQSIQDVVFTPTCALSNCHRGSVPKAGLNLEAANAYASIVNRPSTTSSSILRVAPGDPNNSYLIDVLEGNAKSAVGTMPRNGSPLPQSVIDKIRQWIADGALRE